MFDWKKGFDALISGLQSLWDKIKSFFSGDGSPYNPSAPFGPAQHMNYEGGTPVLTPASYTTTSYSSAAKAVASSPMGNFSGADIAAGVNGNAYIAARRARFAQELKDPNTRLQFAAMMLSEDAKNPIPVAELAMNRSDYAHKTLMQMLYSRFYGPINRGQLPSFIARLQRDPKLMAKMNAAINSVLGGSNVLEGLTDQGLLSDPNGRWGAAHTHKWIGGELFTDWGGGPGGHAGAIRWRQEFMARVMAAAKMPHFTVNDIHSLYGEEGSRAIPQGARPPRSSISRSCSTAASSPRTR